MKLVHPFYRLPLRVDVERLRAEVAQFTESDWQRHPDGFPGNSAIRLISAEGCESDDFVGRMRPTPQLQRCPYIRQILAAFGVVWSRSRLMRLGAGASVPQHSDINYHWFNRVRIHIPVQTDPTVSFTCGDQTVHMAAGEAWIFDNWRMHEVHNGNAQDRIHLVADTAGNAAFWQMVARAQAGAFEQRPQPEPALLSYRPDANPTLLFENFSVADVMPPAEVDLLTSDLLHDLLRPDAPEARWACDRFIALASAFCREWRMLWSLYAGHREGWPYYAQLRDQVLAELDKLPPTIVCASNGMSAIEVWHLRVLRYALHIPGEDLKPEIDRTISAAPAVHTVKAEQFESPVFIVSAPRSGSTLLFETLAKAKGLYTLGGEAHWLVERLPRLQPGAPDVESNRLTEAHMDETVGAHILAGLAANLRNRDGQPFAGSPVRILEKTPKNALRIPFFNALFPDARFIFLWRDPRENLSSIIEAWRSGGWMTYQALPGWSGPWSMLLPPAWEALRGAPIEEVAAFQWQRTNDIALDDLSRLPRERWTALSYADFVRDPRTAVQKLCEFAKFEFDAELVASLEKPLPLSAYTLTPPAPEKWRANAAMVERVLPKVRSTLDRLLALSRS
jgi:hypothetical protein